MGCLASNTLTLPMASLRHNVVCGTECKQQYLCSRCLFCMLSGPSSGVPCLPHPVDVGAMQLLICCLECCCCRCCCHSSLLLLFVPASASIVGLKRLWPSSAFTVLKVLMGDTGTCARETGAGQRLMQPGASAQLQWTQTPMPMIPTPNSPLNQAPPTEALIQQAIAEVLERPAQVPACLVSW